MAKSTQEQKLWIADHPTLGEIFPCEYCGRVFENGKAIVDHVATRHAKKSGTKSDREKKLISDHARLMRIVNPEYMVQKRKAWTEHKAYCDERDLSVRCGKYTFLVHGVFMSQVSTFFTPGRVKDVRLDQLSPETIEAVLLLAYGDAVIVKSKSAAERVHEAVDHIGLTAWIETRRLNDLSDREKDALASDMRRVKEFQRKMASENKDGVSRLMDDFLRSRPPPEKSRLPPYLPTISIKITDPKLLHAVKNRERGGGGEGAEAPEVLRRVTPTLGAKKCYDPQPSYTPGKDATAVPKVEGISPPGKSAILRKILGPVSKRMETDYKEALKKENNSAKFVEVSPEGSKKSAAAEDQRGGEDSDLAMAMHEDSGISSRPTSPEFDDSVEEESVEVIDESTHVKYNDSADEDGELASNKDTEVAKESDVAIKNEKESKETKDLKMKDTTKADSELNRGKGRKRKSTDKNEKKEKEGRTDREEGIHQKSRKK